MLNLAQSGPKTGLAPRDPTGDGDGDPTGDGDGDPTGDGDGDPGCMFDDDCSPGETCEQGSCIADCPISELDTILPITFAQDNAALSAQDQGSCGGEGAPEGSYLFTAPEDGTYLIDTLGSEIDTVVYVRETSCGGEELACNDDASANDSWSEIELYLFAGESVVIFVDGADEATLGEFSLYVNLL